VESDKGRALPLPRDNRQSAIIDATIPLILRHGSAVTSRQIAEASGVAEGTVFRAFGDKESILRASVDRYLDPTTLRRSLAGIDPSLPLDQKIRTVLVLLQERFSGVMAMMSAIGHDARPPGRRPEYADIVADVLAPDLARLNVPAARVAPLLRVLAFSTAIPKFVAVDPISLDELTRFALYGLAGEPKSAAGADSSPCLEEAASPRPFDAASAPG
jgi:AcrR family transcriptional regulator